MRFKPAFLLAAALAAAPIAHAQTGISCSDISSTLDAAVEDFADVTGEEVDDFVYESELRLPGSSACTLQLDWDSILFCLWNHPSEASARAAYTQLSATVTSCLASWKRAPLYDEAPVPETAVEHVVLSGDGEFADMEVLVHLDRYEQDGSVTWEVWYELAYYL